MVAPQNSHVLQIDHVPNPCPRRHQNLARAAELAGSDPRLLQLVVHLAGVDTSQVCFGVAPPTSTGFNRSDASTMPHNKHCAGNV